MEVKMRAAAAEVPSNQSYTTIISINFKDSVFVGADSRISAAPYGELVGNNYDKIIRVCEGFLLLCSGCSYVTDELRWALPYCFRARKPKSFEDALDRVVGWTNFFTEYIRSDVKLILVGSVGNEPMKTGAIEKMEDVIGYVHKRSLVKFKVLSMGSGRLIAEKDIGTQRNKAFLKKHGVIDDEEFEKQGIKIILDALKKASGIDWCTGGVLRAVRMTKEGDIEYVLSPHNPEYCKSEYQEFQKKRLYKVQKTNEEEANEITDEGKRKGKRKIEVVDGQNLKRKKGGLGGANEEKSKGKRKIEDENGQDLKRKKGGVVIRN